MGVEVRAIVFLHFLSLIPSAAIHQGMTLPQTAHQPSGINFWGQRQD